MRLRAALIAGLAAFSVAAPASADTWTVTNGSSDATTPACNADTKQCVSLRTALAASEATKEVPDTINVPAGTININNDLVIQSDITVVGTSARTNIIDGAGKYRGFRVTASGNAKISHFTVRNGAAGQGDSPDGGGILNLGGIVVLDHVRVTGSRAPEGAGGGIANFRGNLLLQHSLVDNNTASDGAGVAGIGGPEVPDQDFLFISDSTVFRNTATVGGTGGVTSRNGGSLASLARVTIADNIGGARGIGGISRVNNGTLQIGSSIVARNVVGTTSTNCGGTLAVTDAGANVENDKECDFDVTGATAGLAAALSNQGGEVDVLAITAASPAVDRGPLATCNTAGTTDARKKARPQGPGCDSGAFELDVAPTVTITSGPTGTINTSSASFAFTSTEPGVSYQCRLTGPGQPGTFSACAQPGAQSYSGLGNGSYTFSVRALDGVFTDPPTASRAFTVEQLDTTITGGPSGATSNTTAAWTFTGAGGAASFQCSLDGAAFASCTSPFTTGTLSQGPHTFAVRALSVSGAPDPTPDTRTITVDSVAPETTITGGPTGAVSSTSAAFTFSSNESGVTFQCSLDGAAFGTCPASYTGLSQGAHTFQVRARDAAGNIDASPDSRSWTADTSVPTTTITGGPSDAVSSTSATFTFSSNEAGVTFQCSLDGAAFGVCPAGYTGLSQGAHAFQVRARDAAGNIDASPDSRSWTVDTSAPNTTIATGPSGAVSSTSATFTFTSNESGVTFQCSLDGATFGVCPAGYTGLSQGSHTFQVRARDAAGNVDGTPDSRSWTVDTITPDITITGGPTGAVSSTSAAFTFSSGEAGVTFQCSLDGAAFAACPASYTGLAQGAHAFQVRARDAALNTSAPATRNWTVDTSAPNTTITGGPSGPVNSTTAAFTFTSNESGVTFQCSLDNAAFGACPVSYTGLSQGAHTFAVRARDAAGNVDGSPDSRSWTVDTVGPDTTLTPITTPTGDQTPTFTFASEDGATFQCGVDSAAFAPCSSPHTTALLDDGAHKFEVRAVDAAGNFDPAPASQQFVVDAGAPNTALDSGPEGAINDVTPTFTFSSDEAGTTFSCSLDGGEFTACASPLTLPAVGEGAHTLAVRARDASGNEDASPATRSFTVDLTPPAAPQVVSGPEGPTTEPSPAFEFAASETVSCRLDGPGAAVGAFGACASPKSFSALAPGDYVFILRAVDAAGNATETRRTFSVTAPQAAQPTPTPSPSATPPPEPTPSAQSVVVAPAAGTVLVRLPGSSTFVALNASQGIPFGSEVDARKGKVRLTALPTAGKPPETADFFDGLFTIHKVGGFIELRLSEKLTGCPKARKASIAQKKPKSRKLWGDGKGKFRTRGQYSAATVRGTKWLVQDTCTTTLTRVTQGVVAVNDFAKRKTVLVKKGKRYTTRAKRR